MKLEFVCISVHDDYAVLDLKKENDDSVVEYRFEISFNVTNDEEPCGGHEDNIKYRSCKIVEDVKVTRVEVLGGELAGFSIEDENLVENFISTIESVNGGEFFERANEYISEEL